MSGTNITACITERDSAEMVSPMPTAATRGAEERGELEQAPSRRVRRCR